MVIPFFGDQFFWNNRVAELGVGVSGPTVKQLTASKLSQLILKLTSDEEIRSKAAALGNVIRSQDGVGRSVEFFHRQLRRYPVKGECQNLGWLVVLIHTGTTWKVSVLTGDHIGASLSPFST
jgi:hypothetical protein